MLSRINTEETLGDFQVCCIKDAQVQNKTNQNKPPIGEQGNDTPESVRVTII